MRDFENKTSKTTTWICERAPGGFHGLIVTGKNIYIYQSEKHLAPLNVI